MISKGFRFSIITIASTFGLAVSGSAFAEGRWSHEQQRPNHGRFERHEHREQHVRQERHEERRWEEARHHERHEHPRRDEVSDRMEHQARQINEARRDGELSSGQAKRLRQQEQTVRQQEHSDLAANDGHLTTVEQRQLNGELSGIEHEIPR
jgi:ribosome-binding protein aMBF1 (putative translation factor)